MKINFREIPKRVYLRYVLLMIPGTIVLTLILFLIRHWVAVPAWFFWVFISIWIVKDVVMFPFVWRSHDTRRPGISRSMIGERGIVKECLDPSGYIQVAGELWWAEKSDEGPPIKEGEFVRVQKIEGLKLYVVTDNKA
jgi:membrane protein implicated in regulation of membrane protease activity